MNTKQYRVSEDLQGGDFGKGRVYNVYEWIEQAQEWCEQDDNTELARWFGDLKDQLDDGKITEQYIMGEISATWTIEFEEITDEQKELYQKYLKEFDTTNGEPACFEEWLDNEWEDIVFERKINY